MDTFNDEGPAKTECLKIKKPRLPSRDGARKHPTPADRMKKLIHLSVFGSLKKCRVRKAGAWINASTPLDLAHSAKLLGVRWQAVLAWRRDPEFERLMMEALRLRIGHRRDRKSARRPANPRRSRDLAPRPAHSNRGNSQLCPREIARRSSSQHPATELKQRGKGRICRRLCGLLGRGRKRTAPTDNQWHRRARRKPRRVRGLASPESASSRTCKQISEQLRRENICLPAAPNRKRLAALFLPL